jgi:hypothetical protein
MNKLTVVVIGVVTVALIGTLGAVNGMMVPHHADVMKPTSSVPCGIYHGTDEKWDEYEAEVAPLVAEYVTEQTPTFGQYDLELGDEAALWVLNEAGCTRPTGAEVKQVSGNIRFAIYSRDHAIALAGYADQWRQQQAEIAEKMAKQSTNEGYQRPSRVDHGSAFNPDFDSPFYCSWSIKGGFNCGVRL